MARVLVSSSALLHHIRGHQHFSPYTLEFRIDFDRPGCLVLKGSVCTTELPCESRWFGKGAMVNADKLLAALKSIADQPITLDLHEGLPCKLYAGPHNEYVFDI